MAKGKGPFSEMYGHLVEGKNYQGAPLEQDDESSEMTPDDEGHEFDSMHIEKAENGHTVRVHHSVKAKSESTAQPPKPHVFPVEHPISHHIQAILKHTQGKK